MVREDIITKGIVLVFLSWSSLCAFARPMSEMHGDCSNYQMDLSREMKIWDSESLKVSGARNVNAPTPIAIGKVHEIKLLPSSQVVFRTKPEKSFPSKGEVNGALALVTVPREGASYKVSMGQKIWLDVVDSKGIAIPSKTFEMQTQCQKIFKVVEFDLKGGDYTLQFSSSPEDSIKVLVTNSSQKF